MKLERAMGLNRKELADMLRRWADNLDAGKSIDIAGLGVEMPEELSVKVVYKEKNNKAKAKLKVMWPVITAEGESAIASDKPKGDVKWIKKEMGEVLKSLHRGFESGLDAPLADVQRFLELSTLFLERAKPAWRQGAGEVVKTARFLVEAVREGNKETIRQRLDELSQLRRQCHDSFK